MKTIRWCLALVVLAGLTVFSGHGEEPGKDKVSAIMKRKVVHSQRILEGLALNDFKTIEQSAEELIAVSKEAEWVVLKTPQYELYSNDFRRTADTLAKYAKDKNIDGAALTYVELTLTCVKCHKHVREVRWTKLD